MREVLLKKAEKTCGSVKLVSSILLFVSSTLVSFVISVRAEVTQLDGVPLILVTVETPKVSM